MRIYSLIIFVLLPLFSLSQYVKVRGTAFDTTRGRNWVRVVVNDTIQKERKKYAHVEDREAILKYTKKIDKLWKDKKCVSRAMSDGHFLIKARKTDSLHFSSSYHIKKVYKVADLLAMDSIVIRLEPEVCIPYIPCRDSSYINYVFIGEKINVTRVAYTYYCNYIPIIMDAKFDATYKLVERLYGHPPDDTIRFTVYDHYGRPPFADFQTVLLYVTSYCGKLIHQKYQYSPLFRTAENKWAAPYDVESYARLDSTSTIKPVKVSFQPAVEFDLKDMSKEWIEQNYPSPYYRISNGKAIAEYGNYVPELVEIKKQTVLKARGIVLD